MSKVHCNSILCCCEINILYISIWWTLWRAPGNQQRSWTMMASWQLSYRCHFLYNVKVIYSQRKIMFLLFIDQNSKCLQRETLTGYKRVHVPNLSHFKDKINNDIIYFRKPNILKSWQDEFTDQLLRSTFEKGWVHLVKHNGVYIHSNNRILKLGM